MEIRRAGEGDRPEEMSRIYAACWKSDYRGILPDAYLDALEEGGWTRRLAAGGRSIFLALEGGRPVGISTCGPARDPAMEGWGELMSLYLLPAWRRRGTGTALLEAALEELRELGFGRAYLWVLEGNAPARAFYEARGFSPDGAGRTEELGGAAVRELRYAASLARREE